MQIIPTCIPVPYRRHTDMQNVLEADFLKFFFVTCILPQFLSLILVHTYLYYAHPFPQVSTV